MNLTLETTLRGVADTLRDRILPALDDAFAGEAARLAEMLVTLCANTVDGAAAVRAQENAAIRALFADAVPLLADGTLAERIGAAATATDPGLRISELYDANGRLRALLVELHACIETVDGVAARMLDRRIWRLMRDAEVARFPS